jgi:hypothetical protein
MALRDVIAQGCEAPVLIFVEKIQKAKQLFKELVYEGINIDIIHAKRTQQDRDSVVRSFREGKIWFLICTELMGRGIDFKGVNLVINYDFPSSAITYIHRIGICYDLSVYELIHKNVNQLKGAPEERVVRGKRLLFSLKKIAINCDPLLM